MGFTQQLTDSKNSSLPLILLTVSALFFVQESKWFPTLKKGGEILAGRELPWSNTRPAQAARLANQNNQFISQAVQMIGSSDTMTKASCA